MVCHGGHMEKDLQERNSPRLLFPDLAISRVGQLPRSANNCIQVGNFSFPVVFYSTSRSGTSHWFGDSLLSKTNTPSMSRIWFTRFVVLLSRVHPLASRSRTLPYCFTVRRWPTPKSSRDMRRQKPSYPGFTRTINGPRRRP